MFYDGSSAKGEVEAYRSLVQSFAGWCKQSHLELSVCKMKELFGDLFLLFNQKVPVPKSLGLAL